jgi:hypothetical protein
MLALVLLGLVGCTAPDLASLPLVGHRARSIRVGEPVSFTVDPRFSPAELAALDAGAVDVRAEGLLVTFVSSGGGGRITRGRPDFGRPYGPDEASSFSKDLFEMWIDADSPSEQVPGALEATVRELLRGLANNAT